MGPSRTAAATGEGQHRLTPTIHVLLPVHNRLEITRRFIESLCRQTYPRWRLILVDDGCTDGTAAHVAERVKDLVVLRGNGDLWWAGALHEGYKYLKTHPPAADDVVYIINDDTTLDPDYFDQLVRDPALTEGSLVISPGWSVTDGRVERGFTIDWRRYAFGTLAEDQVPDLLTTRGLYMHVATFLRLGGFHPWLLPHYLSDLEYTSRARRKGFALKVSKATRIHMDPTTSGIRGDASRTVGELIRNHFFSKRAVASTRYKGNFVLLAAPWRYKVPLFLRVYDTFLHRLVRVLRGLPASEPRPGPRSPA